MKRFLFFLMLFALASCNSYKGKFSYVSVCGVVEQHDGTFYINEDSVYYRVDKPQKLKKFLGKEVIAEGWLVKRHSSIAGGAHMKTYTLHKTKISSVNNCND